MDVDVTAHSHSQAETQESVSLLQATLESTADGILVVSAAGRITSYNRKFVEMWRLPEALLSAGDEAPVLECAKEQLAEPENFLSEVRYIYRQPETASFDGIAFKDGRTFERHSHPQRLGDQIVGRVWSFRDVTEQRRTERLVVQSELRLRLVWENALLAMRLADANGNVVLVNSAYCKIVGKSRSEIEGRSFAAAYSEPNRDQSLADYLTRFQRRETAAQRPADVTYWNGRHSHLEVSDVFLDLSGQTPLMLTIVNDVTARKQAEHRATVFAAMARDLSEVATRRAAAEIIVDAAQNLLGWDACYIYLYDAVKDQFENILLRDTIQGRITDTLADYEALALHLATHRQKLAGLRRKLDSRRLSTPLFDTGLFCHHLEAAYTTMHERVRQGLPPQTFTVPSNPG
jgi:PAS domain S-box-containing protein